MTLTGNICKWGNGQAIRIPKAILDFLKWTEDDKFELITENGELKIKKIEEKKKRINRNRVLWNTTYQRHHWQELWPDFVV